MSGTGVFKLFRYSEGALKQSSFPKVESINFLCHTWVTMERVIAGTDKGRLLVFESGELRREINMASKAVQEQSDRFSRWTTFICNIVNIHNMFYTLIVHIQ